VNIRYHSRLKNANSIIIHPSSNTKFLIESFRGHLIIVEPLQVRANGGILGALESGLVRCIKTTKPLIYALAASKHIGQDLFEYFNFWYDFLYYRSTCKKSITTFTLGGLVADYAMLLLIKMQSKDKSKIARIRKRYIKNKIKRIAGCIRSPATVVVG